MEKITANESPVPVLGGGLVRSAGSRVRQHIRSSIEVMLESGLEAFLNLDAMTGHRHGHHDCQIIGTFSPSTVSVPRVRLAGADGTTR